MRARVRTKAGKVAKVGHFCVVPSFILINFQLLVFHYYLTAPGGSW